MGFPHAWIFAFILAGLFFKELLLVRAPVGSHHVSHHLSWALAAGDPDGKIYTLQFHYKGFRGKWLGHKQRGYC